jgi:hypothetical protein
MHAVNFYIDEVLNEQSFNSLKTDLLMDSHIVNVAFHKNQPHDVLVEYDESFVNPTGIIGQLESRGFHVDITGG